MSRKISREDSSVDSFFSFFDAYHVSRDVLLLLHSQTVKTFGIFIFFEVILFSMRSFTPRRTNQCEREREKMKSFRLLRAMGDVVVVKFGAGLFFFL